jgi:protein-arginine kinase activator protein McsA
MDPLKYNKLVKFLKFFINRPNHLARYLIENDALKKEFISKLSNDDNYEDLENKIKSVYFTDLDQMKSFFDKLINSKNTDLVTEKNLLIELEKELQVSIQQERYEDAIRIRDYLKNIKDKKNIK